MSNITPKDLLAGIFGWGTVDIDDLCSQFEAWDVDPGYAGDWLEQGGYDDLISVNDVHTAIFNIALHRSGFDEDAHGSFEPYYNSLDTHFHVKTPEGEWLEFYSMNELQEYVDSRSTDND